MYRTCQQRGDPFSRQVTALNVLCFIHLLHDMSAAIHGITPTRTSGSKQLTFIEIPGRDHCDRRLHRGVIEDSDRAVAGEEPGSVVICILNDEGYIRLAGPASAICCLGDKVVGGFLLPVERCGSGQLP